MQIGIYTKSVMPLKFWILILLVSIQENLLGEKRMVAFRLRKKNEIVIDPDTRVQWQTNNICLVKIDFISFSVEKPKRIEDFDDLPLSALWAHPFIRSAFRLHPWELHRNICILWDTSELQRGWPVGQQKNYVLSSFGWCPWWCSTCLINVLQAPKGSSVKKFSSETHNSAN